ncbi:MAG: T9SS type A sorting domain-containing protein [Flavobacteriales bacterium]|nr:T9SS type A sorting domain-containing protein [Flavobacteriales bacterium]
MKSLLFIAAFFIGITFSNAQNPGNSLHFDGVNDYVSAPLPTVFSNINANSITIETWIKPQASVFSRVVFAQLNASNFISVSTGGSNQIYFYINNTVGVATNASLPLNQWTHVACTWNGTTQQTEVYFNGMLQTTAPGGSSSTGTDNMMTIGSRTNGAQYFNGELDELRIWDVKRSVCDINSSMNSEFTQAQPNLVAYYNFNQGVAGGNNSAVTSLLDFTTNHNGTLNNFMLGGTTSNWVSSGAVINQVNQNNGTINSIDTRIECGSLLWIDGNTYSSNNNTATHTLVGGSVNGCDSIVTLNLTINSNNTGTDIISACDSYTWINNVTYTSSNNTATHTLTGANVNGCDSVVTLNLTINNSSNGTDIVSACNSYTWIDNVTYSSSNNTATHTLVGGNINGCDSIVTLNLTIINVDNSVTNNTPTLTANQSGASYRWLDCDNGNAVITGETSQNFTATVTGNYAVEITVGNCIDTSACENIVVVGVDEEKTNFNVSIFPNPTNGLITINFNDGLNQKTNYTVTSIEGKVITTQTNIVTNNVIIDLSNESKGVYFLKINSGNNNAVYKLIKQ